MKIKGLTTKEAQEIQLKYGKNELSKNKEDNFFIKIFKTLCEPMFLLLIIASVTYFVLGKPKDGIIMLVFVVAVISIDIIQKWKTDKTLDALKNLAEPKVLVLRDNEKIEINSSDLVPGDIMYVYEGVKVAADGFVLETSGLKVDESILTGESEPIWKNNNINNSNEYWKKNYCYKGTHVVGGTGIVKVNAIGNNTEYGKIGKNLSDIKDEKTPLQKQIDSLVNSCAIIALLLFIGVSLITFININEYVLKERIIHSLLSGITLAMAMIPEEFPVVFTVFLLMGSWRLAKKNSLVKNMASVETLGAVSVLCVDKTGTITQNKMKVIDTYEYKNTDISLLAKTMCLSCEENTFDPMEKAMFSFAKELGIYKTEIFKNRIIQEYPFNNDNNMMGFIRKNSNKYQLCVKGSAESILELCRLNKKELHIVNKTIKNMQSEGLRVIAVAKSVYSKIEEFPIALQNANCEFIGLVGLTDPPRENVNENIELCKKAGVKVVMITGDNGITASSIAKKIGMDNYDSIITGDMIENFSKKELQEKVKNVTIFSRVRPEHKMKIIEAFQNNGEIVAMTGDGVNDAPALKKANIGIAMGKRGSEVAKEASDLILMDDNFNTIVDTIEDGRRIYVNIKKAIEYIFVIHIPIALISLITPLINSDPNLAFLLPTHIVLLELLIDPTCSIVLERGPAEKNIMNVKPRNVKEKLLDKEMIIKSGLKGIVISVLSITIYYLFLKHNLDLARTLGLLTIMISNLFLVIQISSGNDLSIYIIKKLLKDKVIVVINSIMIIICLMVVYLPINKLFKLTRLNPIELLLSFSVAFVAVFWYEIVKIKRK